MVSFGLSLDTESFDNIANYAVAPHALMATTYKYVSRNTHIYGANALPLKD